MPSINTHFPVAGLALSRVPRIFGFLLASSVILIGLTAHIKAQDAQELKTFDVTSDPDFKNYKQAVTAFAHKHRPRSDNDFCVIGYVSEDKLKSAWIIWRQGNEIILWEGRNTDLDSSRRRINLKSDVVPAEEDVHGSTYLATKAWVDKITGACDRSGVKIHVPKPGGSVKRP